MAKELDLQEQEQIDALKAFWASNGNLITWTATLVLACFAGWNAWQWYQRSEAQKIFAQQGLERLNFNLWIDGQQLPRRIETTTPPGSALQVESTMDYTAYNVPVSIQAPPKSQVADGSNLKPGANAPG